MGSGIGDKGVQDYRHLRALRNHGPAEGIAKPLARCRFIKKALPDGRGRKKRISTSRRNHRMLLARLHLQCEVCTQAVIPVIAQFPRRLQRTGLGRDGNRWQLRYRTYRIRRQCRPGRETQQKKKYPCPDYKHEKTPPGGWCGAENIRKALPNPVGIQHLPGCWFHSDIVFHSLCFMCRC